MILMSLPPDLFSGLNALSNLQLIDNDLTTLPSDLFSDLPVFVILNLRE